MRIPKTCKLPDWFTLEPLEDGSYVAMEDPMVKEMLAVFAERYGLSSFRGRDIKVESFN